MRDVVPLRDNLSLVTVTLPDGTELKQSGLRTFAVGDLGVRRSSPTARSSRTSTARS